MTQQPFPAQITDSSILLWEIFPNNQPFYTPAPFFLLLSKGRDNFKFINVLIY